MEKMEARIVVRSYEADSFGHVNNAVFLNYLEYARGEFLKQKGLSFRDFEQWSARPFLARLSINYKQPAFIEDVLVIKGWINEVRNASFSMGFEIIRENDGVLVASSDVVMVFVGNNGKPTAIPEEFKRKFLYVKKENVSQ